MFIFDYTVVDGYIQRKNQTPVNYRLVRAKDI